MAGQLSQVDFAAGGSPEFFVQLRFVTGDAPVGTISLYDSNNANSATLSQAIDVATATPTNTFDAGGYTYYTFSVANLNAGNNQVQAVAYGDGGGLQSVLLFGTGVDGTDTFTGGVLGGQTVTQVLASGAVEGGAAQPLSNYYSISPTGTVATTGTSDPAAPCYVRGTRILTTTGYKPVETLEIGDLLVTQGGRQAPVLWLGSRIVEAPQADGGRDLPVLFTAGSLGAGVPERDLRVSPNHAMFVGGALVAASVLVNRSSIVRDYGHVGAVEYFHVELPSHDVILAEGAAAESFLDVGDRDSFHTAKGTPARASVVEQEMALPRATSARQARILNG